ncbi:MAG: hypothetical protein K8R73_16400 [Clostridiales bacterium]|nr:hypothetical protein [Clostridiales bacterium]
MTGLVNMYAHSASSDMLPLYLANGVTTVRNVWVNEIMSTWAEEVEQELELVLLSSIRAN